MKKEIIISLVFAAVVIFICFHFMERQDFSTSLRLTADEQTRITKELLKRSAGDCECTRAEYGWYCVELGTQGKKVYKVKL